MTHKGGFEFASLGHRPKHLEKYVDMVQSI